MFTGEVSMVRTKHHNCILTQTGGFEGIDNPTHRIIDTPDVGLVDGLDEVVVEPLAAASFGALRDLHDETARIQALIDEEFGHIEDEDRL